MIDKQLKIRTWYSVQPIAGQDAIADYLAKSDSEGGQFEKLQAQCEKQQKLILAILKTMSEDQFIAVSKKLGAQPFFQEPL